MKDSHREPHRAGTPIHGRDAEVNPDLNHEVMARPVSQQASHEAESAVAYRPNVFQSWRLLCRTTNTMNRA